MSLTKSVTKANRVFPKLSRNKVLMALTGGVICMISGHHKQLAFGKQPPPEYTPPFGVEFVVNKLKRTAYGKALKDNQITIVAAELWGWTLGPECKQLTLELGLELAKSPLGVRYRIAHSVWVDWRTGDLLKAEEDAQELLQFLYPVANATARAEMLSEVEQFVREHRRRHRIEAVVRPHGGECYYIAYDVSFSKKDPSGEALILHICGKGEVEDMRRVYVSKDGERREVKLR